jgi:hypothetical protein
MFLVMVKKWSASFRSGEHHRFPEQGSDFRPADGEDVRPTMRCRTTTRPFPGRPDRIPDGLRPDTAEGDTRTTA